MKFVMPMFGRPGGDLADVDAVNAERFRGVVAVVGLRRERLGVGIADAELVDERGCRTFE